MLHVDSLVVMECHQHTQLPLKSVASQKRLKNTEINILQETKFRAYTRNGILVISYLMPEWQPQTLTLAPQLDNTLYLTPASAFQMTIMMNLLLDL